MQRIERSLPQLAAIPILLVWGMQDPVLTKSVLRMWQHMYPHAITHELEDASHFLQEDAPDRIIGWIEQFLAAHP
jgi:haloalkane dehalogenase